MECRYSPWLRVIPVFKEFKREEWPLTFAEMFITSATLHGPGFLLILLSLNLKNLL